MGLEPDAVLVGCGDIATQEALAAAALLRRHLPDLRLRFLNVVDLFRLTPESEHPHGLSDREFDSLFTLDKPVIVAINGFAMGGGFMLTERADFRVAVRGVTFESDRKSVV